MRALLVCLVLTACSSDDGKPDPGDPPVDGHVDTTPVTPQTGAWSYSEVTPVSSTCSRSISNGTGAFAIDQASTTSFHIIPNDGTASFTCSLSGKAFDCPERAAAMEDLRGSGVDAVVTARATAKGNFANAAQASGRQEANITCAGTACGTLGFPCKVVVDFTIRAR
jgi:hypothetical protein